MNKIKKLFVWVYDLFTRPAARIGLGVMVTISFVAGAFFWHYFNVGMQATNEEAFCISCHTMGDNLLPELQKTVHWQNRSGVRARCPDCHVPHDFTDKVARKMQASKEVWGKIFGTVDTPEKFDAKRLELAQHEWTRLKANDSLECRNCHNYESMDFTRQSQRAQNMHSTYLANKEKTCIDCHKGIAHNLPHIPPGYGPSDTPGQMVPSPVAGTKP